MTETRRALVFFNWSFGFRRIYSTVAATGNSVALWAMEKILAADPEIRNVAWSDGDK